AWNAGSLEFDPLAIEDMDFAYVGFVDPAECPSCDTFAWSDVTLDSNREYCYAIESWHPWATSAPTYVCGRTLAYGPSLVVDVTAPSSVWAGDPVTISWVECNPGDATAGAHFTVVVVDGRTITQELMPALGPGSCAGSSVVLAGLSAGLHSGTVELPGGVYASFSVSSLERR
ncbi:MAG: hypothetical protein KDA28_04095, partial [Phycisphaerales bacterium]|nr:hypothetical protein [Phycisphaerales bacterium]